MSPNPCEEMDSAGEMGGHGFLDERGARGPALAPGPGLGCS